MTQPNELADLCEGAEVLLEAYDDLRRYIYDKTPERREYSIGRFRDRLAPFRANGGDPRSQPANTIRLTDVSKERFRKMAQAALTAARPAILEEAAGIAEEYGQRDWFEVGKVVKQASRDIATAIRAAVKP
jgi:hypothetical protein